VKRDGDSALRSLARELDGVDLDVIEVPRHLVHRAFDVLAPALRESLERAHRNIAAVHRAFLPALVSEHVPEPGILVGRRADPLGRVGVYAPGGLAAYPSSVLMGAVPARVAGVGEIVLCSPPGPDGLPASAVLAAAALAGVDRVFALGGAGAIGAMAYGTDTVPRVDRIVGPGNAYVAEAKLQVSGAVAIDLPAGPSELLAVADDSCDPVALAREVIAQAEHDPRAAVVVIALDTATGQSVTDAVAARLNVEPRRAIIAEALARSGAVLVAESLTEAAEFAAAYAPEHLLLAIRDARGALPRFRNAGTVFVGESASVTFGDYMTGANHVLPTGGLARSYSGLSVTDFLRWTTYQLVSPTAAASLADAVGTLASAEGLPAHAAAARGWRAAVGATT